MEMLDFEKSLNEEKRLQSSIFTRAAFLIVSRTIKGLENNNHV